MKAMNFYTQNGWSGSNYDSKLSTKKIASKVRSYAKKNFPGFKFSVCSEWSMYADSLRIKLVGGPCDPFLVGTRSGDRGYMSTTGVNMDYWKNELTPEVFAALYAVTTYASSFRYDDSDAMEDYFDTNFRISVNIDRDKYQVVEPKENNNAPKKEKEKVANVVEAVTVEGLEIVDYSEKAIAVFGDTKAVKEQLKELGGRFNPSLKYNGEKRSGWIFSKKQADKVKELITPTELPALPEEIYIPEIAEETEQPKTLEKSSIWNNLKTLDHSLYDDYKSGLLTLEECARRFAKSGWANFVDIEYTKAIFDRIEHQENNDPLIIEDFAKYGSVDYPTECEEMDGFKLGEVVYDQIGEIGVILAFYEKDGVARLNSNGCCNVGNLKKCPKEIAEREVKYMDIIRPEKSSDSYNVEAYEKKVTGKRYTVKNKPLTLGYYGVLDRLDNSVIDCYPTKEEALKEAERLNGFTDESGRLRRII